MPSLALGVAQRTTRIISRNEELEKLEGAICAPGNQTRVIMIISEGGMGKTRLLEELLKIAGHPDYSDPPSKESWDIQNSIASEILDFTELRLHTFDDFTERLVEAFKWDDRAEFPKYDSAHDTYLRRRKDHVDYHAIKTAATYMNEDFAEDYDQLSQSYRMVWLLDTAEQPHFPGPSWLRDKKYKLLSDDDLSFSTREKLLSLLRNRQLPNTTILLAGRPEAEEFFDELRSIKANNLIVEKIELLPFDEQDTREYVVQIAQDFLEESPNQFEGAISEPKLDHTAEALQDILADPDQIEVLYHYTGGKPVLLALFVDVLIESKKIPPRTFG